ncbi:MAG: hypothetical protein JXA94_05895 [Parachlamydiales bacterium]|nr:hypothetical protein [Parachlamydiales bacterium]
MKWFQVIASKINRDVDLVDLYDASTVFQFQIINEWKVVYCKNESKRAFFENYVDSMYLDLNEFRWGILKREKEFSDG